MDRNQFLNNYQYAYRSGRSTTSAAEKFVEAIAEGLDEKKKVAGVFLDLSKAFDSVNHELLLEKLSIYGIQGQPLELIKSFLTDREQTVEVKVDNKVHRSKPQVVNIGIPQGSSLGNILFIIFLNDLITLDIKGQIIQYADDTTIVLTEKTSEDLEIAIRNTLERLSMWFRVNGLKLNADKTNVMFFNSVSPNQPTVSITLLNGTVCRSSALVRLLGFELDPALTWRQHVDTTCTRMARGIHAIKQIKQIISADSLKETYYAYIHSILSYGIILWGASSDAERVLKISETCNQSTSGS